MTQIRFYHNTPDPLALACELVGRAYHGGRRVVVRLEDNRAAQGFDRLLWTHEAGGFIPHVPAGDALAQRTPVLILAAPANAPPDHDDMLFNLAPDIPEEYDRFRMLVEIIGRSESVITPARRRWQQYKAAGHPLKAFDSVRREAL